jgi:diguanylate cyclase (GGDEF)-like protein
MAGTGSDFFEGLDDAKRVAAQAKSGASAPGAGDGWRVLAEVTDLLNSPIDRFEAVLDAVLDACMRTTGADRGFIMLYDEPEHPSRAAELSVLRERNVHLDALPEQARRISRTIVEEVVRTERGVCIADIEDSKRFADAASVQDLRLLSVMCVPLKVTVRAVAEGREEKRASASAGARKILGVVYVDSSSVKTTFREADLELFQALANAATTAILHADTFRRATTDELTGLATRRHFERRLKDEIAVVRKSGAPLSALFLDVDHLRDVNVAQGYEAGDDLLRRVARVLRSRTRSLDTCARYGGEEFAVLLPQTDKDGAEEVARKVLLGLQEAKAPASIGVASAEAGETAERLVRRVDQALSRAKEEGGGRARPYTEALANVPPRADKLAGIFSGDAASVYRNVLLLLETIPSIHAGSLDRVLPRVLDAVVDLARADRGFLFLRNEKGELTARVGRDRARREIEARGVPRALLDRVVASGEPLSVEDAGAAEADASESVEDAPRRAVMCVPLALRSGAAGAIYVDAEGDRRGRAGALRPRFGEGALAFLQEFARQAAIAIENARLIEENAEKARKIEKLMHALESRQATQERALETATLLAREDATADDRRALELKYNYSHIVGATQAMRKIFKLLDRVTDSSVSVFIHGESGTGKELVAKAIHFNGPRKQQRFIAENCSALTETLLESELFGYMKGAFTGAAGDKKGLFELATGGTIFLDEVGDMTPAMQMKLLRVLQEGEVRRVGGKETIKIDVRVISASNKDIKKLVESGAFREDLYYRLNVVRVDLPPLRERGEDIPLLLEHFLGENGKGKRRFAREAMDLLMRYPWPGNIRELRNVVERAKILTEGEAIGLDAIILDNEAAIDVTARAPAFPDRAPLYAAGAPVAPPAAREGAGAEAAPAARAPLPFAPGRTTPPPPPGLQPGSPLEPFYFELNERQRKLVEYLQTYGSIRNRDYYEIMGVSKSTGWRDLKDLMDREIVVVHGKGKGSVYSLGVGKPKPAAADGAAPAQG